MSRKKLEERWSISRNGGSDVTGEWYASVPAAYTCRHKVTPYIVLHVRCGKNKPASMDVVYLGKIIINHIGDKSSVGLYRGLKWAEEKYQSWQAIGWSIASFTRNEFYDSRNANHVWIYDAKENRFVPLCSSFVPFWDVMTCDHRIYGKFLELSPDGWIHRIEGDSGSRRSGGEVELSTALQVFRWHKYHFEKDQSK